MVTTPSERELGTCQCAKIDRNIQKHEWDSGLWARWENGLFCGSNKVACTDKTPVFRALVDGDCRNNPGWFHPGLGQRNDRVRGSNCSPLVFFVSFREWMSGSHNLREGQSSLMTRLGSIAPIMDKKQSPWPESASELYRPSESYLSAKLVPTFCG
jgi:hypothetical protein